MHVFMYVFMHVCMYVCAAVLSSVSELVSSCVPGVESLVHSLKEALQMSNLEVHKQGLLLLTLILERWDWGSVFFCFLLFTFNLVLKTFYIAPGVSLRWLIFSQRADICHNSECSELLILYFSDVLWRRKKSTVGKCGQPVSALPFVFAIC